MRLKIHAIFFLGAVLATICCWITPSAGAEITIPARLIRESFGPAEALGTTIVGLALGQTTGTADPRDIRIPLDALAKSETVCLTAVTRDGAYRAELQFDVPGGSTGYAVLHPTPDWGYRRELSAYQRSSFAAVVQIGAACETDARAPYLPIGYEGQDPRTQLVVAINTSRAVDWRLSLESPGAQSLRANCNPVPEDAAAMRFDLICTINIGSAPVPRDGDLVLWRLQRTGSERIDRFPIRLP
jgi:hypothetical protein